MTSISLGDDIVRFLHVRLSEDEPPDATDSNLEAEILEHIPGSISKMWVAAKVLRIQSRITGWYIYLGFYSLP